MVGLALDFRARTTDDIPRDAAVRLNIEMGRAIAFSTGILQQLARNRIPMRTGRTAGTIEQLVVGAGTSHVTGYVGSDDQIALILELGSRPHVITPTVKKALWWPGLSRPVSSVRHPGTIPYLWLTRSGPPAGNIAKARLASAFVRAFG